MPADYSLTSRPNNVIIITQSVPVPTAEDMAKNVLRYLDGDLPMLDAEFAIFNNKLEKITTIRAKTNTLESFI
jgi:hypothetical protein